MRVLKGVFVSLLLISCATGCATIVAGGSDKIPINSNPPGAKVFLNGQFIGTTPTIVTLNRKDDAFFRFELDGYETATVDRNKVVNGWVFGNLLIGGLIGLSIDLITSNQGKYSDAGLEQSLSPASKSRTPSSVKPARN